MVVSEKKAVGGGKNSDKRKKKQLVFMKKITQSPLPFEPLGLERW